jgi:hypothetical protein
LSNSVFREYCVLRAICEAHLGTRPSVRINDEDQSASIVTFRPGARLGKASELSEMQRNGRFVRDFSFERISAELEWRNPIGSL